MNPYALLLDRADRDTPECGTIAAYTAHRRRGEQPCGPCRTAANTSLDDHRRLRAELQATIAAEGIQL